jgi:hypothetical protein
VFLTLVFPFVNLWSTKVLLGFQRSCWFSREEFLLTYPSYHSCHEPSVFAWFPSSTVPKEGICDHGLCCQNSASQADINNWVMPDSAIACSPETYPCSLSPMLDLSLDSYREMYCPFQMSQSLSFCDTDSKPLPDVRATSAIRTRRFQEFASESCRCESFCEACDPWNSIGSSNRASGPIDILTSPK